MRRAFIVGAVLAGGLAMLGTAGAVRPKPPPAPKPVIGKPVLAPAHPLSSKTFAVSFRVTRSDTHKALLKGTLSATPSIAGKALRHTQTFRNGRATVSFLVPPNAMGKRLTVKITIRAKGGSATKTASFPILRGQPLPSLSIGDNGVTEGSSGTTALTFKVTLSAPDLQPVSVDYSTADGTALAPGDYTATSGTLTFAPGTTTQTVSVPVVGDSGIEPDETFAVNLTNPVTATIADGAATGLITNDDFPPHSGHYGGTTSEGKPISLDMAADLKSVTHIVVESDWDCHTYHEDVTIDLGGFTQGLSPDWGYGFDKTFVDGGTAIVEVKMHGQFTPLNHAEGTVSFMWTNLYGGADCVSDDLHWSATGP